LAPESAYPETARPPHRLGSGAAAGGDRRGGDGDGRRGLHRDEMRQEAGVSRAVGAARGAYKLRGARGVAEEARRGFMRRGRRFQSCQDVWAEGRRRHCVGRTHMSVWD
jgi:hypothetical protein